MSPQDTLSYPLDRARILLKKRRLKKALLEQSDLTPLRVAVLGGSTTSELINILELFLLKSGYQLTFYESEYNKYYEDALFNIDAIKQFSPNLVIVHTSSKNILEFPALQATDDDLNNLLEAEIQRYQSIWDSLSSLDCAIVQNNFDLLPLRTLGNMDSYALAGAHHFIAKLNIALAVEARARKGLYLNDINYLCAQVGLDEWHDANLWHTAKYAMSMESIVEIAFSVSKIIAAAFGKSSKCLVLDLDNTCWGGVIGDDGLDGIAIGTETAYAEAFTAFQRYAKQMHARGVTLAVCSKNDFDNAKEGFSHPDTVLKFEDFTAFKANWEPKSLNISEIASDINIGIDSLVFVDDNPVEREIVRQQAPLVSVPDVGDDVSAFALHVDRNGYFEPVTLSEDDLKRNQQYEQNKQRTQQKATFANYGEYLLSLEMSAEISSFAPLYLDRITQLTNKTNQFNLTTRRYTASEIEDIASSDNHIAIYGKLTDKFGDNGLIAITVASIKDHEAHIDLWLMSCRVLKRDMEQSMLDELVRRAKERGISKIVGYYYRSAKNNMVETLYETFGFQLSAGDNNESVWTLDISDNYKNQNKYIEVTHEH